MKKRFAAMLAALLWALCLPALAETAGPKAGTAVTTDYVQLLDAPDEGAGVRMNYYPGVRVHVEEILRGGVARVTVGAENGSISGYMPAELLAFGEAAVREHMPSMVRYSAGESVRLYSACDKAAERVGEVIELGGAHVLGASDAWLHVRLDPMMADTAFVDLSSAEISLIQSTPLDYTYTFPMEGEVTQEEAIGQGKRYILENGQNGMGWNHDSCTQEILDRCAVNVSIAYYPALDVPMIFEIFFETPAGVPGPEIYAWVNVFVRGAEIVYCTFGNG